MFVSLQFKLELKREDKEKLVKLMRKQSSAIRVAYNMLKELEKEETKKPHAQIYHRLRQLFPELPTKYVDSAIYKLNNIPQISQLSLEAEDFLKNFAKITLQEK